MKFYFCEGCGQRVTENDLSAGEGKDKKLKGVYCKKCAVGVSTMETPPLTDDDAKKLLTQKASEGNPPSRPRLNSARGRGALRAGKSSQRLRTAQPSRTEAESARKQPADSSRFTSQGLGPSNLILLSGVAIVGGLMLVFLFGSSPPQAPKRLSKMDRTSKAPAPVEKPEKIDKQSTDVRKNDPVSSPARRTPPLSKSPSHEDPVEQKKAPPKNEQPEKQPVDLEESIDPLPPITPAAPGLPVAPAKKDPALEKAQAALAVHLKALEVAALNRDHEAASEIANTVRDDPVLQALEMDRKALVDVALTLRRVETKRLETLHALKDGKRHSFPTTRRTIAGVVSKITEDGLDVRVQGRINGNIIEYGKHVRFSDLTPKGRTLVFGNFEPRDPDEWCLQALYRLARGKLEEVPPALAAAGTHPLRAHLKGRLAILVAARRNAEARQFWETHLARWQKEKLTLADLPKAKEALETLTKQFEETKFYKDEAEQRARLEASIREVDSLIAHWKFEEDDSGKLLHDATGRGHHGKSTQGKLTGSSEAAPGLPGDQGSVILEDKQRVSVDPIELGTEHTVDIWLKFRSPGSVMGAWMSHTINIQSDHMVYGWGYNREVHFKKKLEKGKWYHFLLVRKEKQVALYCDGKRIGEGTLRLNKPHKHDLFGYNCACQISDVRLYGRAFSEDEVARVYARDRSDQESP